MVTDCSHFSLHMFELMLPNMPTDGTCLIRLKDPGQEQEPTTPYDFPTTITIPIFDGKEEYDSDVEKIGILISKIFELNASNKPWHIVCHCNAGLSRSQTVTSFVHAQILNDPYYEPVNKPLYKTMCQLWDSMKL